VTYGEAGSSLLLLVVEIYGRTSCTAN